MTLSRSRRSAVLYCQIRKFSNGKPTQMYGNIPALKDNVEFKNIALQAAGGRSSVSGIRATVFGAGSRGLGHQIVNRLGSIGTQCILPYRDDGHSVKICKGMGDLGQIVPVKYQIRDKDAVMRAIEGSNVCINLLTAYKETKNFSYHDIHVNATHMIVKCAYELGVDRFIFISCANAAEDSPSEWCRTKWLGEQIVKEYYPECTILRPSMMFGRWDKFILPMAESWRLWFRMPYIVGPDSMVQPVCMNDVSLAVLKCVVDPLATGGKTYELYGDFKAKRERWMDRVGDTMCAQKPYFKRIEPAPRMPILKAIEPIHRILPQLFFRVLSHFIPAEDVYTYDAFVRYSMDWVEPNRPYMGLRDLNIKPTSFFDMEPDLLYYYTNFGTPNLMHHANIFEDENPGPTWEVPGQQSPMAWFDKKLANWPIPNPAFESEQTWEFKWVGCDSANDFWEPVSDPQNFKLQGSQFKKTYYKHLIYDW